MKHLVANTLKLCLLGVSLAVALTARNARAGFLYWDPEGAWGNYSTYTLGSLAGNWEDLAWSTSDTGQATPVGWTEGSAAFFGVGTGSSNNTTAGTTAFTVTLNQNHTVAGVFDGAGNPDSAAVSINGPGLILLAAGEQGIAVYPSSDHSQASLIFNTQIIENTGQPATFTAEGYDWSGVNVGSPQIYLNATNGYTGGTELGFSGGYFGGTINFNNPYAFGFGPIKLLNGSGSALLFNGTGAVTVTNAFTIGQSGNLNLVGNAAGLTFSGNWNLATYTPTLGSGGSGNQVILSGVISGTGGLAKGLNNTGVLVLTGTNTYTGTTTVGQGVLAVNAIADSGASAIGPSGTLALTNSGILRYTGTAAASTARTVTGTGTPSIDLPAGDLALNNVFKANPNGAFTVTKTGTGTLTLGGSTDNAYLGFTVNGGKLVLNKASGSSAHALGSTTTINNGGTLVLSGTGGDQIYSGVNVTVNSGGVFDANGMSEGMTSLTLNGTGISNGGALINNTATTATITATAANGFPLAGNAAIGGSGNITLQGVVSGAKSLTYVGTGVLKLNSANTYTGGTIISSGTVEVAGSLAGSVTNNAGVLQLDNTTALANTATLTLAATPANGAVNLNFAAGTSVSVSSLYFGSTLQAVGTWGGPGSGAQHISNVFTGTGMLTVSGAPLVVQVPQSVTTYTNCYASFTVSAVGSVPMTYQWALNGTAIPNATQSTYTLLHAQHSDAGTYTCLIQNGVGSTNTPSSPSAAAVLTVLDTGGVDGYANEILNNPYDGTPMAYYRLDETAGTTVAHDVVGGYNGVYNSVTLGQAGFSPIDADTAAGFGPGQNSYVGSIQGITFAAPTSTTAFSLEAWVKGGSSQTSGAGIITKGTGNGGEQFNLDVYNGVYRFFMRDSTGVIPNGAISATVGPNGTWQHVVAVYDGPNGYYALFVNGLQVGSQIASAAGVLSSTHEVTIGSRQSASGAYDNNFNGSIDEVAIYNVALNGTQVYNHYQAQLNWAGFAPRVAQQPQSVTVFPGPATVNFNVAAGGDLNSLTYQWLFNGTPIPGANTTTYTLYGVQPTDAGTYTCALTNSFGWTNTVGAVLTVIATNSYESAVLTDNPISYWRLDETNGTTAYDYWGGNNGTYNNVVLNQSGYAVADPDPAIGLPANSANRGYVSVANYTPFTFVGAPPFAFEGWVNFSNVTGVQRLFSTMRTGASPNGYGFGISGANQLVFTTAGVLDTYANLSAALVPGIWYHLVCTCDGGSYYFYVNGQQVATQPVTSNTGVAIPVQLGANPAGWPYPEQVNGRLDEMAIYNSYLTPDRVLAHYNARPLPTVPVPTTPVILPGGTNYVGLTATLQEHASGQALSYQWYKVGSGAVSGATDSSLTRSPLTLGDAGTYYVQVSNQAAQTNSPTVVLTVWSVPTSSSQLNLTNGLVLHLQFDGDYKDTSGHGHNGTAVGAPTLVSPGIVGSTALSYSSTAGGPYNYVTLGAVPDLQFGTATDFTVAYWVQLPPGSTFTNLPFFGTAVGSTGHGGFSFAPGLTATTPIVGTGGWGWTIGSVSVPSIYSAPNYNTINDGNWHHLVHVVQRSANCTTYLDGVQVDSTAIVESGSTTTTNAATIGQDPTGTYPATASAYLDDLAVWTNTLSQLDVSGIYLAGTKNVPGVTFAPPVTIVAPVTITGIHGTTLTYTGGAGTTFTLLSSPSLTAPLASWTVVGTSSSTPGSFTIPAVGSSPTIFYRIKSQ